LWRMPDQQLTGIYNSGRPV